MSVVIFLESMYLKGIGGGKKKREGVKTQSRFV